MDLINYKQDIELMKQNWAEMKDWGTVEEQTAWKRYYDKKIDELAALIMELENEIV